MLWESHFKGIVRARAAAAKTLLAAIPIARPYTEHDLAERWLKTICNDETIFPFGWYQPPPHGVSVLIGTPPHYERLNYQSLRAPGNFPSSQHTYTPDSIIYPYYSAIDKKTMMVGDHVGTYYSGDDSAIREWIKQAYHMTKDIISHIRPGMRFSDLHETATLIMDKIGARNNNFSISGGLAADIGHTVPFFGGPLPTTIASSENYIDPTTIAKTIANERKFVSKTNDDYITDICAFTIEPQLICESMPMVSFHFIVVIISNEVFVVEKYYDIFEAFKMTDWMSVSNYCTRGLSSNGIRFSDNYLH